jgi:DNA-binding MarR family transcriptional regulator/N-acetylglutamate synthase-like GNAT family acetyltransferase
MQKTAIETVRSFNRRWTEVLGLLDQGLLETEHSLAEARVLFELAQQGSWERAALRERLGMDASFLSRVLRRLEERGLLVSTTSDVDGRALDLELTDSGRSAFADLDRRSADQIDRLLAPLTAEQVATLTESMTVVSKLVGSDHGPGEMTIRGLRPGDLGWVVERNAAVYADGYGWDADFEALVARIVADYRENLKAGRENAWIAELDGARAGCVFCCERDEDTAQLRILLVEPWARGHGIGSHLVAECIEFARRVGYSSMMLWTNDVLVSARRIYEAAGFRLVEEERHHSFGHDLAGQTWELEL